jgi:hypothetical protein
MNVAGNWTGDFRGTNSGGLSLGLDQQGNVLGGVATMHEPRYGTYQYVVSDRLGSPTLLKLNPAGPVPGISLGVVTVQCSLASDGEMTGQWSSSIGTKGVFSARRYNDPSKKQASTPTRKFAFISYCHDDKPFLDELTVHLKPLEKRGLLDPWSDSRIKGGNLWKEQIDRALQQTHIAVLLISPGFLASDFIVDNELPPILQAAKEKGVTVLPLILRTCGFTRDPHLSQFQAINDPSKPLAAMPTWERDKYYDMIADTMEKLAKGS